MNNRKLYILILIFFWTYLALPTKAQENGFFVEIGEKQIKLNEPFTLIVTLKNVEQIPNIQFPEIEGFKKTGAASRTINPITIAGKTTINHIVTQQYFAKQVGFYEIPTLFVTVGDQKLRLQGSNWVTVAESDKPITTTEETITIAKEDVTSAFLAVIINKKSVYIGQGFNLRVSFFVADDNASEMNFFEVEKQLEKVKKQIKPANCWEENHDIREIISKPTKINGISYTEHRIYQASFFPFNTQSIRFPSSEWTMAVKKGNTKSIQTFRSKPAAIFVKPLPIQNSKTQISVGNYQLFENISRPNNNYKYEFTIVGEGNITAITAPNIPINQYLEVYPPDQDLRISHTDNGVSGQKKLTFQIIPQTKGPIYLGKFFWWAFFNEKTQKLDTLRSKLVLNVDEIVQPSTNKLSNTDDLFYDEYIHQDLNLDALNYEQIIKTTVNVLLIAMLLGMIYIFRKT